jgi:outer membrane protein insertion porin family
VQEIASSPTFFEGVDRYLITRANSNVFGGPITDAVTRPVSELTPEQLQQNPNKGFVDKFGDTFDNFTITGNWFRNTLNRG